MLGLGVSIINGGTPLTRQGLIASSFASRVTDDGGIVENPSCLQSDLSDLVAEATPFTTGLVDIYKGAEAAYSLRQLRRSVSPYAIRVRRSSDDTEKNIGFDSKGDLDTNTLLDFVGSGDGWVATWFDQSSNGNDATQSTESAQPQIVSSGEVIMKNGRPAIEFDKDSSTNLNASGVTTTQPTTVSMVVTSGRGGFVNDYFFDGDDATDRQASFISGSAYSAYAGSTEGSGVTAVADLQVHGFILFNGSSGQVFFNDTGGTADMSIRALSGLDIGQRYSDGNYLEGKFQELIFWNADHSGRRDALQDEANAYYSIYS